MFLHMLEQNAPLRDDERIDMPMSRSDIANHLGLSLESVSRALGSLRRPLAPTNPLEVRTVGPIYVLSPSQPFSPKGGIPSTVVSAMIRRTNIATALRALFTAVRLNHALTTSMVADVELPQGKYSFRAALEQVLRQGNLTYRVWDGVYVVSPRVPAHWQE